MGDGFKFIPPNLGAANNSNENSFNNTGFSGESNTDNDKKNIDNDISIGFGRAENEIYNPLNGQSSMSDAFSCSLCNSSFAYSNNVDTCFFCGSANLNKTDSLSLNNYFVIPFMINDNVMLENYRRIVKSNIFLPSILKKQNILSKIKKVYLPCSLYDLNVSGNIQFTCCDETQGKTKIPVATYDAQYSTNFDYNQLLISTYTNISSDVLNCINDYNFNNLSYFDGVSDGVYYVKGVDLSTKINDLVSKNSINIVRNSVNHKFKKVKSNSISVVANNNQSVLVPVYILNLSYKGKKYLYLMNGQTGKTYYDFSVDIIKIIIISLGIFLLIFIIILLFAIIF